MQSRSCIDCRAFSRRAYEHDDSASFEYLEVAVIDANESLAFRTAQPSRVQYSRAASTSHCAQAFPSWCTGMCCNPREPNQAPKYNSRSLGMLSHFANSRLAFPVPIAFLGRVASEGRTSRWGAICSRCSLAACAMPCHGGLTMTPPVKVD